MKKIDRSFSIIAKAITLNLVNICIYYPKMMYMAKHPERYSDTYKYKYGIRIINAVIKACRIKINAYGLENLPKNQGFYLCANHQEKFDPLAIWSSFPGKVGVILNDKACHRPFIKELCVLIKSKKLIHDNMHSILSSFDSVTKELKAGTNYLVFPEGEYESEYNKLSEFHAGCFKSPRRAKCPIVPVVIKNSYRIFDKGFLTTLPIDVHYLNPIYPEEYENLTTKELAVYVRDKIKSAYIK